MRIVSKVSPHRWVLLALAALAVVLPLRALAADATSVGVDQVWILLASALVFFMQCGFLCLEVGSVQPKAAVPTAFKNVVDWTICAGTFFVVGWGLMFGHSAGGLIGTDLFMLEGSTQGAATDIGIHIHFLFQLAFAGTAATIISGALAERTSFQGYMLISTLVTMLIYPVIGHWAWGNSYFADNPTLLASRGFVDFAGSTVVHSVGGWVSLVGIWFVGPRIGRFGPDGQPRELPNTGMHWLGLGTLLLWFSWWAFNGGSTLRMSESVGPIIINTNLGGTFGGLGALLHCWLFQKKEGLTGKFFNGILVGLVSVTAGCFIISPLSAMIIGLIGGVIANLITALLLQFRLDDPVGAVPVHLGGGIWGTMAVGFFGKPEMLQELYHHGRLEQTAVQFMGVSVCAVWVVSMSVLAFGFLKLFVGLRVSPMEEILGFEAASTLTQPEEEPMHEAELVSLLENQ